MHGIRTRKKSQFTLFHGHFPFQFRDKGSRRGPLHQSLLVRDIGCQPAVKPEFGFLDTFVPRLQRPLHDEKFVVQCLKVEIGIGDFGYQGNPQRPPGLHTGEIFGKPFLARPSQVAPQVNLPREPAQNAYHRIIGRIFPRIVRVLVLPVDPRRNRRPQFGTLYLVPVFHFLQTLGCHKHVLVVFQSLPDKILESGIGINLPPFHIRPGQ